MFEHQSAETFQTVCRVKVTGINNLDKLTREKYKKDLDWFIAFSSSAAGLGNVGQSNYSYANSYMERVVERRQRDHVPGETFTISFMNNLMNIAHYFWSQTKHLTSTSTDTVNGLSRP